MSAEEPRPGTEESEELVRLQRRNVRRWERAQIGYFDDHPAREEYLDARRPAGGEEGLPA